MKGKTKTVLTPRAANLARLQGLIEKAVHEVGLLRTGVAEATTRLNLQRDVLNAQNERINELEERVATLENECRTRLDNQRADINAVADRVGRLEKDKPLGDRLYDAMPSCPPPPETVMKRTTYSTSALRMDAGLIDAYARDIEALLALIKSAARKVKENV